MNPLLKKLLLALIASLLGVMSGFVMAQTNYNFTYTDSAYGGDSGPSASGIFTVNGSGLIIGISGTVSGSNGADGAINGLLYDSVYYNDNSLNYPGAPYYLTGSGVGFYTGSNPSGNEPGGTTHAANAFAIYWSLYPDPGPYYGMSSADDLSTGLGSMTVSPTAVAPEMNASHIPQVGLLLGCLFFLFGRRKENTESILTA